eukprot:m51a1_g6242 hypothetical protein (773) ;mRNA; f:14739-17992
MEAALLSTSPRAIADWVATPQAARLGDAALLEALARLGAGDDRNALAALGVPAPSDAWPPAGPLDLSGVAEGHALAAACAALDAFVTENFTGPVTSGAARSDPESIAALGRDGEPACAQLRGAALLVAAWSALRKAPESAARSWLRARIAAVHQRCLSSPSSTLREEGRLGWEGAERLYANDDALAGPMWVERAAWHTACGDRAGAATALTRASEALGLRLELAGAMGKRTKYQEKRTAQMFVDVAWHRGEHPDPRTFPGYRVPEEVRLEDASDLLDHIEFDEPTDATILSPAAQAYALAVAIDHRSRQASHEIRTEEMMPYIERVLRDPTDWSVNAMALLAKSRLEATAPKTGYRSLRQFEAIVAEWSRVPSDREAPAHARRAAHFIVWFPHIWDLKREFGHRLYEAGDSTGAFKLFEELEMFEEMVKCLLSSGKKDKAEEIARSRLQLSESPEMICMLGDVTDDPSWYARAWEVSGKRFPRAKRSLGHWYLRREKWSDCIAHYLDALALNPIFPTIWFSVGCAALRVSDWHQAQKAFSRCVSLDGEDAEAWSNLAAAQMRLDQPAAAQGSLKEAVRLRPDSWRMWQSYLGACMMCSDYGAAIAALTKLLELSNELPADRAPPREPDPRPILRIFSAILDGETCRGGYSASELAKPLARLLQRYDAEAEMSAALYDLSAHIAHEFGDFKAEYERRCGQCRLLEGSWPGDEKRWKLVAEAYADLASAAKRYGDAAALKSARDKVASAMQRAAPHHAQSQGYAFLSRAFALLQ